MQNPQLLGVHRFQLWLTESGRVADDDGSPWWREVNGLLILDVIESATTNSGSDGPIGAWSDYLAQRERRSRTAACWTAHQGSLRSAAGLATDTLADEPAPEQLFIGIALESVNVAARANLPTGRTGSSIIGGFCGAFYPDSYPAGDGDGRDGQALLAGWSARRFTGLGVGAAVVRHRVRTWSGRAVRS